MSDRTGRMLLLAAALFAMLWAIARAALQSITIDEAVSYLVFVRPADTHWFPAANNHLLNTLLERPRLFFLACIISPSGSRR